jgi:hypothetical protein
MADTMQSVFTPEQSTKLLELLGLRPETTDADLIIATVEDVVRQAGGAAPGQTVRGRGRGEAGRPRGRRRRTPPPRCAATPPKAARSKPPRSGSVSTTRSAGWRAECRQNVLPNLIKKSHSSDFRQKGSYASPVKPCGRTTRALIAFVGCLTIPVIACSPSERSKPDVTGNPGVPYVSAVPSKADAIRVWRSQAQPAVDRMNDALAWVEGAIDSFDYTDARAGCRAFGEGVTESAHVRRSSTVTTREPLVSASEREITFSFTPPAHDPSRWSCVGSPTVRLCPDSMSVNIDACRSRRRHSRRVVMSLPWYASR